MVAANHPPFPCLRCIDSLTQAGAPPAREMHLEGLDASERKALHASTAETPLRARNCEAAFSQFHELIQPKFLGLHHSHLLFRQRWCISWRGSLASTLRAGLWVDPLGDRLGLGVAARGWRYKKGFLFLVSPWELLFLLMSCLCRRL